MRDVVRTPRTSLREGSLVHALRNRGRLQLRDLALPRAQRDSILIREGLDKGCLICLSRLGVAVNGMSVRTADGDGSTRAEAGNGDDA